MIGGRVRELVTLRRCISSAAHSNDDYREAEQQLSQHRFHLAAQVPAVHAGRSRIMTSHRLTVLPGSGTWSASVAFLCADIDLARPHITLSADLDGNDVRDQKRLGSFAGGWFYIDVDKDRPDRYAVGHRGLKRLDTAEDRVGQRLLLAIKTVTKVGREICRQPFRRDIRFISKLRDAFLIRGLELGHLVDVVRRDGAAIGRFAILGREPRDQLGRRFCVAVKTVARDRRRGLDPVDERLVLGQTAAKKIKAFSFYLLDLRRRP